MNLMAILICGVLTQNETVDYSPEQARRLLELHNESIRAFEVDLLCTSVQYFTTDIPTDFAPSTQLKKAAEFKALSLENVIRKSEHSRQMFLNDSRGVLPMRRIEVYGPENDQPQNVFAFDGSIRRSHQPAREAGIIGGPPKDFSVYAGIGKDYLEIIGLTYRGRPITDYFQSPSITVTNDGSQLLIEAFDGVTSGNIPMNGYRIWLDPSRGTCPSRFEHYQVIPKMQDDLEIGGDGIEHVLYNCVVEDFLHIKDSIWVPARALTTQHKINWKPGKGGSVSPLRLYDITATVDIAKSTWNKTLSEQDFVFDFPPATRVRNELLGVDIIVGKEKAGSNIDDLLAHAASVIPVDSSSRPLAKGGMAIVRPNSMFVRATMILNGAILCAMIVFLVWRQMVRREP